MSLPPDSMTDDVLWVVNTGDPFTIASVRYSALIPSRELQMDFAVYLERVDASEFLDRMNVKLLALSKAFDTGYIPLADEAKRRGIRIVFTMADWLFEIPEKDRVNRHVAKLADAVVVPTRNMAQAVQDKYAIEPILIEESYESPYGSPAFAPGPVLNLLWHGHHNNLDYILGEMPDLLENLARPAQLTIICDELLDPAKIADHNQDLGHRLRLESVDWSMEAVQEAVPRADAILVPSVDTLEKRAKGQDRVVESIRAGRLAVAFPLPQYFELADYCWLGKRMSEGVNWALAHPEEAVARITAGQGYIDTRFAPAVVARKWLDLFRNLLAAG